MLINLSVSELKTLICALHIAFGFDFEELDEKLQKEIDYYDTTEQEN